MPIQKGKDSKGYYYQFGDSGKKYYYDKNNKKSEEKAQEKAVRQGRAIKASQSRQHGGKINLFYDEYQKYKHLYLNMKQNNQDGGQKQLVLSSPNFENNGAIGKKYYYHTCKGENIFPTLEWSNISNNTKSFALIVDDPDAPKETWIHLICWNIPNNYTKLNHNNLYQNPIIIGKNSWGKNEYGGPCPPYGIHRYFFKLYALNSKINLIENTDVHELKKQMKNKIIDEVHIMGIVDASTI